jgi:hypothetical protein
MSETWELFALSPLTLNQEKKNKEKSLHLKLTVRCPTGK